MKEKDDKATSHINSILKNAANISQVINDFDFAETIGIDHFKHYSKDKEFNNNDIGTSVKEVKSIVVQQRSSMGKKLINQSANFSKNSMSGDLLTNLNQEKSSKKEYDR